MCIKVIQKVGLCICVYDILEASDGLIGHGTGIVNINGSRRMQMMLSRAEVSQSNFVL